MNDRPAATEHPNDDALVALMEQYQDGSLEAFETLYAALARTVNGYFRVRVCADALVADLAQDTFLEMHRSRRTYQPGRPVRAWVFGIARHVLLRHLDDERRRSRHESSHDPLVLDALAQAEESMTNANLRDVGAALSALSPGTRRAWVQHHVEGKPFSEIAQTLGVASTAARLRASRASAAIRRALGLNGSTDND